METKNDSFQKKRSSKEKRKGCAAKFKKERERIKKLSTNRGKSSQGEMIEAAMTKEGFG